VIINLISLTICCVKRKIVYDVINIQCIEVKYIFFANLYVIKSMFFD